eukprot:12454649-Ditylum_brightwellii.AAC.1
MPQSPQTGNGLKAWPSVHASATWITSLSINYPIEIKPDKKSKDGTLNVERIKQRDKLMYT